MEKSKERIAIYEKMAEFEKEGKFDIDLENDPPFTTLMPDQIDYLRKSLILKIKRNISYKMAINFVKQLKKQNQFFIDDIIGQENIDKVLSTGAIVTCNHFHPFDSFALYEAFKSRFSRKTRMYKVIREGNYTGFTGMYGFIFKHCDTLPLSSNMQTMKKFLSAVDTLLQRKQLVLVYPEQALWWNYRKPRPFKVRAFKFATKNNVPVLPVFITMKDSEFLDGDGFPVQRYTIHIGEPIYSVDNLSQQENATKIMEENFNWCKNTYESVYGEKLEYSKEK